MFDEILTFDRSPRDGGMGLVNWRARTCERRNGDADATIARALHSQHPCSAQSGFDQGIAPGLLAYAVKAERGGPADTPSIAPNYDIGYPLSLASAPI